MGFSRGKQPEAARMVVYGVEGIGKTTFASMFPKCVFLDVERGTSHLDVPRYTVESYAEAKAITESLENTTEFATLVIDSADWLDQLIMRNICMIYKAKSIEDFGWGKGYAMVKEVWNEYLGLLERLRRKGLNVILISHAVVKKVEKPNNETYDHWDTNVSRQAAPILKQWADELLFMNYEIQTTSDSNGRVMIEGRGKRVIYTNFHAAYDAKNRHNLPDKIIFSDNKWDACKVLFDLANDKTKNQPPEPPAKEPETVIEKPPVIIQQKDGKQELYEQLKELCTASGVKASEIKDECVRNGFAIVETPISNYHPDLLGRIIGNFDKIKNNILKTRKA